MLTSLIFFVLNSCKGIIRVIDDWAEFKDMVSDFAETSFRSWERMVIDVIRPMDLSCVRELLLEAQEVEHTIKGKDIVLLLGVTGAGKSTTAQFLAGKRMTKVLIGSQGQPHILPERTQGLEDLYDRLGFDLDKLDSVYFSPRYEDFFTINCWLEIHKDKV